MNDPIITFCILHYRRIEHLKRCVDSIEKFAGVPYKIMILNQGYMDKEIFDYLTEINKKKNIEVIFGKENIGIGAGKKLLIEKTTTKFIMPIDDDNYLVEGCLKQPFSIFELRKDVGTVCMPLYDIFGNFMNIGGSRVEIKNGVIQFRQSPKDLINRMDYIYADSSGGGTVIFRKELKEVFTWDERFKTGFDDIDKSMQIRRHGGWKEVIALRSKLIHDVYRSREEYHKVRSDYKEVSKSYRVFCKKWNVRYSFVTHIVFSYFFALMPRFGILFLRDFLRFLNNIGFKINVQETRTKNLK